MVRTGLDVLIAAPHHLRGRRYALIANHTSVTADLRYGWDALAAAGIPPVRIFSPEHGLYGVEQDQVPATAVGEGVCPVVSLYGSTYQSLSPTPEHFADIDAVVFDIQDIGARYYTYVNTLILVMRAIAAAGAAVEVMVLDRPNPLGGAVTEGPLMGKEFMSFVGMLPIPVRHGMTAGELARFAVNYYGLTLKLTVLSLEGWRRDQYFSDTGLPWVAPSPNMPSLDSALLYPGMCLLEGTIVSEGRGTTIPFQVFGAPGLEPRALARQLDAAGLPGIRFRPLYYRPTFNKFAGEIIGGVQVHVVDRKACRPFLTGVAVVAALREHCPGFMFRKDVYEFNDRHPAFDLLAGNAWLREMIEQGRGLTDMEQAIDAESKRHGLLRGRALLYE